MYQSHWGLRESPFPASHELKFFYESPMHNEALARLNFLVQNKRRLGLLLGESGSGKTLLLDLFARQWRKQGSRVATINLVGLDADEFLWTLAVQLGGNPPTHRTRLELWREITDTLAANRYQQINTVILLDDSDQATNGVLAQSLRLLHTDPSAAARLTMVLAAQTSRAGRLGKTLLNLAELRAELVAWDEDITGEFLASSMDKAGRQAPVFDEPATSRLHELGQGVPRQISQLAELALLAAASQNMQKIDSETVEAVYQELSSST